MSIQILKYCFLFVLTALLSMLSCQKKELELNLVETKCKNFKIHTPSSLWVNDPSCGGTSVEAQVNLSFRFDGDADCIDLIRVNPQFYKSNNTEISNLIFKNAFEKTDGAISISDKTVNITFRFQFANLQDADALNHIYFKINTENELGNKSKNLELRINSNCSTVDPSTYSVVKEFTVQSDTAQIELKDDASEDGDIVSIFLNGKWVLENLTLTNAPQTFTFTVNKGDNHLVLFAVNEGKVGPNTVSLSVNGTNINISPDLLKGEAVNIKRF